MSIGVFIAAQIVKARGRVVSLWQPDFAYLTGAEIVLSAESIATLTLSLEAPYEEGLKLIGNTREGFSEDGDLLNVGNNVRIQVGYTDTGRATPWYQGILRNPGVSIGPNGFTANVVADGGTPIMMAQESGRHWSGIRKNVILDIAKSEMGLDIEIDTDEGMLDEISTGQSGDTYWVLLTRLLKEANYGYYVLSSDRGSVSALDSSNRRQAKAKLAKYTLVIKHTPAVSKGEVRYVFELFGATDFENGIYPVMSFSAPAPESFTFASASGVSHSEITEDGEIEDTVVSEKTSEVSVLGAGSADLNRENRVSDGAGTAKVDRKGEDEIDGTSVLPDLPVNNPKGAIQAHRDRMMGTMVEGTITTIGIPEILPYELLELRGCSSRFNGIWLIREVTHSVGLSGYETTLAVTRNAFGKDHGFAQAAQTENASSVNNKGGPL